MIVNMVNSNYSFSHNPEINKAFNEQNDKDKFLPDGVTIAYVKSNYCEYYHQKYIYLKNIKADTKKKQFTSSITFGVINDDNIYEVRIFRVNTIGISGLTSTNKDLITYIANKVVKYINDIDPTLMIKLEGEPKITLCNVKYQYTMPEPVSALYDSRFNMHSLREVMDEYNDSTHWHDGEFISLYIGDTTYYSFKVRLNNDIHLIKLYNDGKINICGGSKEESINKILNSFLSILNEYEHKIINRDSIPVDPITKIVYGC